MDIYIVYSMLAFELDILHQFNRYFIYDLNIGVNNRLMHNPFYTYMLNINKNPITVPISVNPISNILDKHLD